MAAFQPYRDPTDPWYQHDDLGHCPKTMELRDLRDVMVGTKYSELIAEAISVIEGNRMRMDQLERNNYRLKNKISKLETKLIAALDDIGRLHAIQDMEEGDL